MIKKANLLVIFLAVLFSGCFKPEEVPVLTFDGEANMTIADFQKRHTLSTSRVPTLIEEDIIITGIVTSTDKYGSSYKEIYFQDETGGLCIRTSSSSYYNKYRIGQRIFVKAKGLYLGNYVSGSNYGHYQLGDYGNTNGGMEYLSAGLENRHVFRHGIPEPLPTLKEISSKDDIKDEDYHTLVRLKNCRFAEADSITKYYEERLVFGGAANQPIKIIGTDVIARISSYSTFANDILPTGTLDIVGILTKFGSTSQFIICSIDDVEIMPEVKILKSYDMFTNPFSQEWSNKQIQGVSKWDYYTGSPGNVRIQPPAGEETECWFVSPKQNFAGEKGVTLNFSYRIPTGTGDNAKVAYTVDGANWIDCDFKPKIGATSEAVIKLPENVASNPNLQIAFQYKTTETYPMWAIFWVTFKGNVVM